MEDGSISEQQSTPSFFFLYSSSLSLGTCSRLRVHNPEHIPCDCSGDITRSTQQAKVMELPHCLDMAMGIPMSTEGHISHDQ